MKIEKSSFGKSYTNNCFSKEPWGKHPKNKNHECLPISGQKYENMIQEFSHKILITNRKFTTLTLYISGRYHPNQVIKINITLVRGQIDIMCLLIY